MIAGRFAERTIRFGTMVVLSRLLLPAEFGLFVLGLSIAGAVTYIRSFGVDAALIQRQDTFDRRVSSTAFAILSISGVLLFAAFYLVAPLIAGIFPEPSLLPVIRTLGLSIIIGTVSKVPLAQIEKRLEFRKVAVAEICGRLGFTAVAIALAFAGFGVWSLVTAYLTRQAITATAIWRSSGWQPLLSFDRSIAKELVGFGKFIVGSSMLRYLQSNLDKMILGRILGAGAVGLYGLAFNIANLANSQVVQPLRAVMFPTFSQLQDDRKALKRAFLKSVKYIVILAAPLSVGLVFLAPEFVTIVYTERWIGAAKPMQILACYGLIRSISDAAIPLFRAIGLPQTDFGLMLMHVVLIAALMAPAVTLLGTEGAAVAMLLSGVIVSGVMIRRLHNAIRVTAAEMFKALRPGFLGASVLGLFLSGLKLSVDLLATPLGPWALPLAIAICAPIYLGCLWLVDREGLVALGSLLRMRKGPEGAAGG